MWNKLLVILFILLFTGTALALRIPRPLILKHPITPDQVSQLNKFLEDVWNMQYGRFEVDVVTTEKANANDGELWILNDSGTYKLQFKAGGSVHTITP